MFGSETSTTLNSCDLNEEDDVGDDISIWLGSKS